MYPILCKVQYETLHRVFQDRAIWVQIGFSIVVNWIFAPLIMVRGPRIALCQFSTYSIILIHDSLALRGPSSPTKPASVKA
jgi:ACR3 family arsenite efflux pump ArsB